MSITRLVTLEIMQARGRRSCVGWTLADFNANCRSLFTQVHIATAYLCSTTFALSRAQRAT